MRFLKKLLIFAGLFLLSCGYKAPPPGKPDWTPPVVNLVFPKDGDTLFQDTPCVFTVRDESQIKKVILFAGSRKINQDSTAPFEIIIFVDSLKDSVVTIKLRAYDAWDNMGESQSVKVFNASPNKKEDNSQK